MSDVRMGWGGAGTPLAVRSCIFPCNSSTAEVAASSKSSISSGYDLSVYVGKYFDIRVACLLPTSKFQFEVSTITDYHLLVVMIEIHCLQLASASLKGSLTALYPLLRLIRRGREAAVA